MVLALLAASQPASARSGDGTGRANTHRDASGSVWVVTSYGVSTTGGGSSGCVWRNLRQAELAQWGKAGGVGTARTAPDGTTQRLVAKDCSRSGGDISLWWADEIDPVDVAAEARERLVFPDVTIAHSPPNGATVNTWTWLDATSAWQTVSATATAGPITATVTATPVDVTWDMGPAGETITCDNPGGVFQTGDDPANPPCGYLYRTSSAGLTDDEGRPDRTSISATVRWHISWTSNIGAGNADWGGETRTGWRHDFPVHEIQALLSET